MPAPIATASPTVAARDTWAAHYCTPDGFRYIPSEELVRFCGRRRGKLGRVLEVGCGNGANLWYLAQQSDEAIGIDFCDVALQAARELCVAHGCGHKVDVMEADAHDLPFTNGSFDTVVDAMVSQHVSWDDHAVLFKEYRRVLKRGGTAFLYHLVRGTTGSDEGTVDFPDGIALFPEAGRMCLPHPALLTWRFVQSGFRLVERRGLVREYPDGEIARYAVIEGTAI